MANCEFYLELMSQSLDGELTQQAQQALEEHLSQCADCRFLYQQLCEIHDERSAWEEQEVPEGFAQGVMDRIRALEEQPNPTKIIPLWKRPQFKALGSVAACALLCLGIWQLDLLGTSPAADTAAGATTESSVVQATGATNSVTATPAAEPQAKLADMTAANTPVVAADEDLAQDMPAAASPVIVPEKGAPQAFSLERGQLPDNAALLQSVTDALGFAPGALLVLEEIPQELLGTWHSTADGLAFLEVQTEHQTALFEQLSPAALLSLTLDDGPLVLLHWS